jgi:hypothetical protein
LPAAGAKRGAGRCQFDRFHLARDLKRVLRKQPEASRWAMEAFEQSRVGELLEQLRAAEGREADPDVRAKIALLRADIEAMPEAARDHRVRLRERGYDVTGLRGIGAAVANMDKFGAGRRSADRAGAKGD